MNKIEIWQDVAGYEGAYMVSSLGRVKSMSRFNSVTERILKGEYDKRKYYRVRLSKNNKTVKYQVHRLVTISFIPNPENKKQINHIDGNQSNNCINNLEWCTQSENMIHAYKYGLQSAKGESNSQSKLRALDIKPIKLLLKRGMMHKNIAKIYNVSRRCITDINLNKTWINI